MMPLFIAGSVFLACTSLHVIVHRTLVMIGIVSPKTIAIYLLGLFVLVRTVWFTVWPVTAISLYCLLVAAYLLYFLSYLHDAESPSAKVLDVVRVHGPLGRRAILAHFTDEELIRMRLTRLIRSGWITKKGRTFVATQRGAFIAGLFARYRRLLAWGEGG